MTKSEQIRTLQKSGEFHFSGMNREESCKAAEALARQAAEYDRKYGIQCRYGIVRDAFGYYYAVAIGA